MYFRSSGPSIIFRNTGRYNENEFLLEDANGGKLGNQYSWFRITFIGGFQPFYFSKNLLWWFQKNSMLWNLTHGNRGESRVRILQFFGTCSKWEPQIITPIKCNASRVEIEYPIFPITTQYNGSVIQYTQYFQFLLAQFIILFLMIDKH